MWIHYEYIIMNYILRKRGEIEMKNKFNIDDKVIYEGELYTISGIDKMNGYLVYKIDPIKEDEKEYVVSEEDIDIYIPFNELSKEKLLDFIKTYDNYVEICFGMKQKPKSIEGYYNSKQYRILCKEKLEISLSSHKICLDEKKEEQVKYVKDVLRINDKVKNKITGRYGIVKILTKNRTMVYVHYNNSERSWEHDCNLERIDNNNKNDYDTSNKSKPIIYKPRFSYGDEVYNLLTRKKGIVKAISKYKQDSYYIEYINDTIYGGIWEDGKNLYK